MSRRKKQKYPAVTNVCFYGWTNHTSKRKRKDSKWNDFCLELTYTTIAYCSRQNEGCWVLQSLLLKPGSPNWSFSFEKDNLCKLIRLRSHAIAKIWKHGISIYMKTCTKGLTAHMKRNSVTKAKKKKKKNDHGCHDSPNKLHFVRSDRQKTRVWQHSELGCVKKTLMSIRNSNEHTRQWQKKCSTLLATSV